MKAIILAAGKGSRLAPITDTTPKPLVSLAGKSIIERIMGSIHKDIDEFYIIVKYKKELFNERLGDTYKGKPIHYIEQGEEKGTAAALWNAENLSGEILLLNGDTIFHKKDYKQIISSKESSILVKEVADSSKYGIFKEDNGYAQEVIEKPQNDIGNLANLGVYKFDSSILNIAKEVPLSSRGEYEFTDAINSYLQTNKVKLLKANHDYIDITYSRNILDANQILLSDTKEKRKGTVENGVEIRGKLSLGKNTIIKSGTYIEGNCMIGENCVIGPNAYLRNNVVIGDNCKIGNAVEIKNTAVGNNTNISHLSYIGDSIIGNNVNIAGGMLTANLRHDKGNIKSMVKGELIDTGRYKLGAIIGDNVKTGARTTTMPGRIIETDSFTIPGKIIK